jgi:hypothetical protein
MTATWALIIFFHVGMWGDTDSNATSVVDGFATKQLCEQAKKQVPTLVSGTKKEVRAICVQTR